MSQEGPCQLKGVVQDDAMKCQEAVNNTNNNINPTINKLNNNSNTTNNNTTTDDNTTTNNNSNTTTDNTTTDNNTTNNNPNTTTDNTTTDNNSNKEEEAYLRLIEELINEWQAGRKKVRIDRTGVGTISTFGCQFRYNCRGGRIPLLTTKRVFWRGILEEMLWFVRGSTNAKELSEKKVGIWDANASRSFLDSRGLYDREEGDLGPVYGFQWRHFGAKYTNMKEDYTGKGVDQLKEVIEQIKTTPTSRRMLVSAWNVPDLSAMALPPCHIIFQFYVEDAELSLSMYQRSADMGLGVPFNIASYSLLLHMVAMVTGLEAGDFIHTTGDTHIYANHIPPLQKQLLRKAGEFPVLKILRNVREIDDFETEDFQVLNYHPHPPIKMAMAV